MLTAISIAACVGLAVAAALMWRARAEGARGLAPTGTAPPAAESQTEPTSASEPPAPPTAEKIESLRAGLESTRGGFVSRLAALFRGSPTLDPEVLASVEEVLITADIGVPTAKRILARIREAPGADGSPDEAALWDAIRSEAAAILAPCHGGLRLKNSPAVVLVVGVNGAGKTTTIGKLASKLQGDGKTVLLAAADTFRAAAVLQLEVWGRRVGCPVVKGKDRADPASVVFDAIQQAQDQQIDVVIADTAGRLHTKVPLMDEIKKVHRTVEKALGSAADQVLLVLDATTGQNAIRQASVFKEALPLDGIVLTKLDGTAKGGAILGIVHELAVPVRFVGVGERVEDLHEFDSAAFVTALFAEPGEHSTQEPG